MHRDVSVNCHGNYFRRSDIYLDYNTALFSEFVFAISL